MLGESGVTVRERRIDDREGGPKRQGASPRVLAVVSDAYIAWLRGRSAGQLGQAAGGDQRGLPDAPDRPLAPGFGAYVTMARLPEIPPYPRCISPAPAKRTPSIACRVCLTFRLSRACGTRRRTAFRAPNQESYASAPGMTVSPGVRGTCGSCASNCGSFSPHVARPVVLHGTGGVGKTQIALEYVHRFKNTYDLVWWVDCGQPESIDLRMADLAPLLRDRFGVTPPAAATVQEQAHTVSEVLSRGGGGSPLDRRL